jgi:uncharacterized metal-binding protein
VEYAVGALVGIIISPDLDVDKGNISNAIIRNRFGHWIEKGWNVLWYPYKKSLKHGSPLSHWPVISTVFRLAYLFFFLLVVPYLLLSVVTPGAWDVRSELLWWLRLGAQHYGLILGLIGSDLIHWTLDVLTKENTKQKQKIMILGMPLASSTCK